jgi:Ni/Co efflux regulator RcnB
MPIMKQSIPMILAFALCGTPALASNKHWHEDKDHWQKHEKHDRDDDRDFDHRAHGCYFIPGDVRIIHEYYAPRYRSLPPGLQKKYERTGQLPPGWQKKLQPFPVELERRLIVLPPEYRRGMLDGYAVVYEPRRQVIIDVVAVF